VNAAIRTLAVSILLLPGCDSGAKKDDAGAKSPPTAQEAAKADATKADAKPADAKPADAKPAEKADPAPTGGALRPGQPGYDCGRLLSKIEIESVCGAKLQEVTIDRSEGSREQVRCSRRWRNEDKSRTISLIVGDYGSAEKAKALGVPDDAKDFPNIGDQARGYVEDKTQGIFWHTMRTTKGQYNIDLRGIVTSGGDPLCNLEQLGELSMELAKRIEQVPVPPPAG
jgi:hypothetical protein